MTTEITNERLAVWCESDDPILRRCARELASRRALDEWIACSENRVRIEGAALPKAHDHVLVYFDEKMYLYGVHVGALDDDGQWHLATFDWTTADCWPTHWMPLPDPPRNPP